MASLYLAHGRRMFRADFPRPVLAAKTRISRRADLCYSLGVPDTETLDHRGRPVDHPDYEPPCDISGTCEPFESDLQKDEAMCRFCGGWRRRDYPTFGNWGIPEN